MEYDFLYRYKPIITKCQSIQSPVQFVCLKNSCDRTLLTRWFSTVASILTIANYEFEVVLKKFHKLLNFKFVVKENYCFAVEIDGEIFDNVNVPVIVGSQLWFMLQQSPAGSKIDYLSYGKWRSENAEPVDVMCPTCCFEDYIPLCCFFLDQKMYRLPTLAIVDCRKIHIRRPGNYLNVFVGNVRYGEDTDFAKHLEPLFCVKQDILKMRDLLSNFSFHTVGKIFAKRLEMSLSLIASVGESNRRPRNKVIGHLTRMDKDFSFGNITCTLSQRTTFANSEMGGQCNETNVRSNDYNTKLRKSEIENKKGFIKDSSRYIQTPVNHPIHALFAPLHCVKLASVDLKTKSHQVLQSASCAYFDKIHTVDNKNVGCHLEILPGVTFVQRNVSVEKLKQHFINVCSNIPGSLCSVYFPDITRETLNMSLAAVEEILRESDYPLSLYYWPKKSVCIVYSSCFDIVDERFSLTPITRECLLNEFPEQWYARLSPKISGNVPIFGVLGHQFMLLHHDSTSKLVPGFSGIRHALGLPLSCKVPSEITRGRYLVYPQNDFNSNNNLAACSMQKVMVVVTALRAMGVEDGIIVNKDARDKGFGLVLNECLQAQFMVTHSSHEFVIAVPTNENTLEVVFKESSDNLRRKSVNVKVKIPEHLRHQRITQNTFLCDVLGISHYNSFCVDINVVSYQSASRIFYKRYYDVGNCSRDYRLLFDSICIRTLGNPSKCNLFISLNFTELRPLELGDKFSTIDGQKATVVSLMSSVDMPFIGGKGEFPSIPDLVLNISSSKRQTLGLNLGGACMTAKIANVDNVDLSAFRGDCSVKHSDELTRLLDYCKQSGIIGNVRLFDGRTGRFMGKGDLYCLSLLRYEQDGTKSVFYTHWDDDFRTPNGDFQEKGRGRKGGLRYSQTETMCINSQGGPPAYLKQLQQTGEPRTNFNANTSTYPQSFISAAMTCNIHNLNLKPILPS